MSAPLPPSSRSRRFRILENQADPIGTTSLTSRSFERWS